MWIEFELKSIYGHGGKHILIDIDRIKSIIELESGCLIEYGMKEIEIRDSYKDVFDAINMKSNKGV